MLADLNLQDKHVLVLGYARSGRSVAEYLLAQGAKVTINEKKDLSGDPSFESLVKQGVQVISGDHPLSLLDQGFDFIVKNPGIPYQIPFLQQAQQQHIPIYTDIEIASWINKGDIIGITGSNGKTTITQLVYEILKADKPKQTHLAGNIGIPIMSQIDQVKEGDALVCELSSFQLQGTAKFRAEIAVFANIYSVHLDYHETRANYIQAKLNLVRNSRPEDVIIYNYDQEELADWLSPFAGQKVPFASSRVDDFVRQNGAYIDHSQLYFRDQWICDVADIQIPGQHNVMNVLAAVAVAIIRSVEPKTIRQVILSYQGMPHRIQPLGEFHGRKFFNDSKATNTVATITALKSFDQPIHYIGGGLDRGNGFDDLIEHLSYVKAAYLYGQTKEKLADTMNKAGIESVHLLDDLYQAVELAYHAAKAGEVVLFSPACASWDQFDNFEQRGDLFVETVHALQEKYPYA